MKTFDVQCFELAKHFLQDEPQLHNEECTELLAEAIQEAIESEIDYMKKLHALCERMVNGAP